MSSITELTIRYAKEQAQVSKFYAEWMCADSKAKATLALLRKAHKTNAELDETLKKMDVSDDEDDDKDINPKLSITDGASDSNSSTSSTSSEEEPPAKKIKTEHIKTEPIVLPPAPNVDMVLPSGLQRVLPQPSTPLSLIVPPAPVDTSVPAQKKNCLLYTSPSPRD